MSRLTKEREKAIRRDAGGDEMSNADLHELATALCTMTLHGSPPLETTMKLAAGVLEQAAEIERLLARTPAAPSVALPECVTRWRSLVIGWKGDDCIDDMAIDEHVGELDDAARDCLEWLATTPNPAAIVAASSDDAEVLRKWARSIRPVGNAVHIAIIGATILDRGELVTWLRDVPLNSDLLGRTQWFLDMPPALRALLDGEGDQAG